METIIIKEISYKPAKGGQLMILKLNGNKDATIAPFEKQEQDFLAKDVGIGGSFSGEIVVNGAFTNIKNIDFESAVKNDATQTEEPKKELQSGGLMSVKDISIVSQCLTKCVCYGKADVSVDDAWKMYHAFVLRFEQEG